MLCFIVPVKSKVVSSDWPYFSKLVERTLNSLSNQDDSSYEIIMVCHEVPDFNFKSPKLHIIHADFDPPQIKSDESREESVNKKEFDKASKIKLGFNYASRFNPDYVMVVDSDDLISNKIVSFVESQDKGQPGWYINKGYNYREGAKYLFYKNRTFNHLCGSAVIIRPDLTDGLFVQNPLLWYAHDTINFEGNLTLKPLPFPAGIYSIANGENHFMSPNYAGKIIKRFVFDLSKYRQLFDKISKYRIRILNNRIRKSFHLYPIES